MNRPGAISAAVAVLLLAGLYVALRNSTAGPPSGPPQARAYHLSIRGERLVSGPELMTATEGDTVTLFVTADRAAALHIHGYEQEIVLEPAGETTLTFTANRAGRYGVDFHGAEHGHIEVAALEVKPR
jgi:plastocyanin